MQRRLQEELKLSSDVVTDVKYIIGILFFSQVESASTATTC
jgi:hypothetical protein